MRKFQPWQFVGPDIIIIKGNARKWLFQAKVWISFASLIILICIFQD